jgi:membrane protein
MASLKERGSARLTALRERRPLVEHVLSTGAHYSARDGNGHAGAVTFFGFLSFFPILALAFFTVGYISEVYPDVRRELIQALEEVLPGVVGDAEGEIPLSTFEANAATVGWLGLLGLLYSGLGWISGMRTALAGMFVLPRQEHPNFLLGKGRDLLTLVVLGVILLVSVSLSGGLAWFSGLTLGWLGLDGSWLANGVLFLVGHGLAIAATTVLFVAMFTLLAQPHVARRAIWQGAVAGAVGFELLKGAANFLIEQTKEQPAFQAFGVALILLVWINYFSRLVMLSASWAYAAPVAEHVRELEAQPLVDEAELEEVVPAPAAVVREDAPDAPLPAVRLRRRRLERIGVASAAGAAAVAVLTWLGRRARG